MIDSQMIFPLTDVQWAYMLGRKAGFKDGNVATHFYNEILSPADIDRYEQALNRVIDRHPMLRTVISDDGTQRELERWEPYRIRRYDLRALLPAERQAFIEKRRGALSHHNYPAGVWPMFTFEAAQVSEREHHLFISIDLAVADASSIMILFKDLNLFYEEPDRVLEAPQTTFRAFVQHMERVKVSKRYADDKAYWAAQLPDLPGGPKLPRRAAAVSDQNRFKRLIHIFDDGSWAESKAAFTAKGMVSTTFLCECYRRVLEFWSGSSRFSINLTTSNRGRLPGTEGVIGDFTSLTILPMPETGSTGLFWDDARRLQRQFIEVYAHSAYDGIQVERDYVRYHGLRDAVPFPVVFTSIMGGGEEDLQAETFGQLVYSISQTPQVYLDCQISEEGDALILSWDYSENYFEPHVVNAMFDQLVALIRAAGDPERVAAAMCAPDQDIRMIEDYNCTAMDFPDDTLADIVRRAEKQYASAPALMDGEAVYTYEETARQARLYAIWLQEHRVQPGDRVCVRGYKNAETIFQILGCVLSGAVFVPVHPDYPADRAAFIARDSRAVLCLDGPVTELQEVAPAGRTHGADRAVDCGSEAYVIYTSGSTGTPKGVVITHKAVCNTLYDVNRRFKIGGSDRIFNVSDIGFDLSVYDIFGSQLCGAAMVIGRDVRHISEICDTLIGREVTVWNSVPAIFTLVLDHMKDRCSTHLKTVFLSGDWLPLNSLERMRRVFPEAVLISLGGATEASVWSIFYPVKTVSPEWHSIPYGYPLANQRCYVMNAQQVLCPVGVPGEIYIGGTGVAAGYTDPEQTRRSYLDHPQFGRLYKTGDSGVFEPSGYISLLGRIDQQVKLHGYRIECMEIEKEIERHPAVSRALVEMVSDRGGRKLMAYLVPDKQISVQRADRREWLAAGKARSDSLTEDFFRSENRDADERLEQLSLDNIKRVVRTFADVCGITAPVRVGQFCEQCGIRPLYRKLMQKWFSVLERSGAVSGTDGLYDLAGLTALTPDDIRAGFDSLLSGAAEAYERQHLAFFSACMLHAGEILSGDGSAVELLFPEGDWERALSLYHNNPRSAFNNSVIADIIHAYAAGRSGGSGDPVLILEVGAGVGGTAGPVLEQLRRCTNVRYHYTDLSPFFTAQAARRFADIDFVTYGIFDLDQDPGCQGCAPESYDIVLAANVMHDASDIRQSLRHMLRILKPEGLLILLEVTKEVVTLMTTVELLEGFSSYSDFRVDRGSPLLDCPAWREVLIESGFESVQIFPDETKDLGENVIVAQRDCVSRFLSDELDEIRDSLKRALPPYMMPGGFIQLDALPMGSNGKVSRRMLPRPEAELPAIESAILKPETDTQRAVYGIWSRLLDDETFGIRQSFFEIGGDSLLMIRAIAEMEQILPNAIDSRSFLENPTIEALAAKIDSRRDGAL